MPITAPIVPSGVSGMGMKKGKLAGTPYAHGLEEMPHLVRQQNTHHRRHVDEPVMPAPEKHHAVGGAVKVRKQPVHEVVAHDLNARPAARPKGGQAGGGKQEDRQQNASRAARRVAAPWRQRHLAQRRPRGERRGDRAGKRIRRLFRERIVGRVHEGKLDRRGNHRVAFRLP